jgi:general secretion pathway protein N
MRTAPLVALGVVAYAAFIVATVPARFVAAQIESRANGAVHMHEAHGTLWQGAAGVDVAIAGGRIALDNVAWRFLPAQLLQGRVAFAVDARSPALSGRGTIGRDVSSWHAAGEAAGDAAVASSVFPLLATWRPEGRVTRRSNGLTWDEREARGTAQAEWRGAAVALSQVRPLGTYRVTFDASGANGKLALATLDGPLRVSGSGEVVFPGRFTFNGEARAQGPAASSLDPLLALLGPRRPDGARTLAWRTS